MNLAQAKQMQVALCWSSGQKGQGHLLGDSGVSAGACGQRSCATSEQPLSDFTQQSHDESEQWAALS